MEFDRLYPPIGAHSYLTLSALRKTLEDSIRDALVPGQRYRILDLGCGGKPYYPLFRDRAADYVGIDIGAGDVRGVGESLPFKDNAFDLVVSTQTLEHVDDPARVAAEIHRVLAPGGILILSTHGIWFNHGDHWRWTDTGLQKLFSPYFQTRIRENGGSVLCLFQILNLYAMHVPVLRRIVVPLFNVAGRALDRCVPIPRFLIVNYTAVGKKT